MENNLGNQKTVNADLAGVFMKLCLPHLERFMELRAPFPNIGKDRKKF